MTLSHNALIRGFNSIYQLAPRLPSRDYADFVSYCLAWHACITKHHEYEETDFFPAIERAVGVKGIMDGEIHEHGKNISSYETSEKQSSLSNRLWGIKRLKNLHVLIFHGWLATFNYGLDELEKYLKRIQGSDPEAYFHSPTLLRILDSFSDPLLKHLASEPQALLNLSRFSSNPNSPGSYPNPPARPDDSPTRYDPRNPLHHPAHAGFPSPPLSSYSAPTTRMSSNNRLSQHRTLSSASLEPRPALYPTPMHMERPRPNLGADLVQISAESSKKQMSMDFMFNVLPVFLLNMETKEFEGGMWHEVFPPAKGAGRWVLYGAVPRWKGNKVWRFCSCGKDGSARRLCA